MKTMLVVSLALGLSFSGFADPTRYYVDPTNGVDLPHADFAQKDLVVLAEGADGCYLHLAETTTEKGARHLLAAGLDLAADLPEAVALTDELVDYLR